MKTRKMVPDNCLRLVLLLVSAFGWSSQSYALKFMALEAFDNNLYRIDTDNPGSPEFLGLIGTSAVPDLIELIQAGPNTLYTLDRRLNSLWTVSLDDLANPIIVGLDRDVTTHPRGIDLSPAGALYAVLGHAVVQHRPSHGHNDVYNQYYGCSGCRSHHLRTKWYGVRCRFTERFRSFQNFVHLKYHYRRAIAGWPDSSKRQSRVRHRYLGVC